MVRTLCIELLKILKTLVWFLINKQQKDYGEYMLEKSIKFADNLRKLRNRLAKYDVKYIACGRLRARELEKCKQCIFLSIK